ncbi:MAG: helix-turn-helix domain-containing protein [Actinomycetota bacterium]
MKDVLQSGIDGLDRLVDDLRRGDNVVWLAPRALWPALLLPFARGTAARGLCYVRVEPAVSGVVDHLEGADGRVVLVNFNAGKTTKAPRGIELRSPEDPRDIESVQLLMKELEDELGPGAGYVFDSLSAMQRLWGPDAALGFFMRHCPRLYELDTVAYWVLDPEEHDASFINRVKQVTQVVLEVGNGDDPMVRVAKADARPAGVVGRLARLEVEGTNIAVEPVTAGSDRSSIGERLKRRRVELGMSQSDLARRLGITPSALSQAEHGRRGLSETTMGAAWKALGVGDGDVTDEDTPPSFAVARRGARRPERFAPGVESESVFTQPGGFEAHLIAFAPGASGRRPLFPTKRPEFVAVNEGILQLRVGEAKEVLHAGDAAWIADQPIAGWSNPSPTVTRVMWIVLP